SEDGTCHLQQQPIWATRHQMEAGDELSEIAWVSSVILASMYAGGFGLFFNLQSALTIIGTYFRVKRPLANGLAMAGSPVVLSTLAPLNQFLLYSFGWRGSFLVLGSIVLNCCVAGALMRPVNIQAQSQSNNDSSVSRRKTPEEAAAEDISSFSANPPAKDSKNKKKRTDEYSAPLLLPIFSLVDMFSRSVTGFLANSRWIRPKIQSFFSFAVSYNGVYQLLCPLASGYGGLVVYVVFLGLAIEMLSALLLDVLMDLVGAYCFSNAVGLVTIIKCGPVLPGPHISGALVDVFRDYKYMKYACGVLVLVPGVFLFIMHYYNYKKLEEDCRQNVAVEIKTSEEA
ncbi:hypothetical protein CCH79_00006555, partial [Gambusia affinis]